MEPFVVWLKSAAISAGPLVGTGVDANVGIICKRGAENAGAKVTLTSKENKTAPHCTT